MKAAVMAVTVGAAGVVTGPHALVETAPAAGLQVVPRARADAGRRRTGRRRTARRRAVAVGLAGGLSLVLGACAGGSSTPPDRRAAPALVPTTAGPSSSAGPTFRTTTTVAEPGGKVPSSDPAALEAELTPLLAAHGYRVQRVAMVVDSTPLHVAMLSLYAVPDRRLDPDGSLAHFPGLLAAVVPTMFERYPGLGAVDLCEEPFGTARGIETSAPVLRVLVRRPDRSRVGWSHLDLVEFLRAATDGGDKAAVQLYVDPAVRLAPTWKAAVRRLESASS